MTIEVPFNEFVAFAPTVTILRVTPKRGHYVVEYYAPRTAQSDLFSASTENPNESAGGELKSPSRFTFDTDPIGCERKANAWGSRGKK